MERVVVTKRGAERIGRGHPWIYRSDLAPDPGGAIPSGAAVEVADGKGHVLGTAFWSVRSKIALRMVARARVEVDRAFLAARLDSALALRERL